MVYVCFTWKYDHQAESSDGLTFKRLQEINTIGGSDVTQINGKYYLFTCANGISYSISDNLVDWSKLKRDKTMGWWSDLRPNC